MILGRVLLRPLLILGACAFVVSWYSHATREYVEIRVKAEHVNAGVLVDCVGFASEQTGVEDTVDLGWLKPQDIVSIEFTRELRDDVPLGKVTSRFSADSTTGAGRRLRHQELADARSTFLPSTERPFSPAGPTSARTRVVDRHPSGRLLAHNSTAHRT
jgi:hypothetical protein